MIVARRVGVALAAAAMLMTAACSHDDHAAPRSTKDFTSYVAMGDSSVSGPGISPQDPSAGACQRSQKNWPALLAKALHIRSVHDVSCGGAISTDISTARLDANAVQPQIAALSADTNLVTVSIGGNDEGLFTRTIVSCLVGKYDADKCTSFIDDDLDGIVKRTTTRVASALARIRKSAPNARIVAVGYLRLLPADGGCTMPGLTTARVRLAAKGLNAMSQTLKAAAKRAKVEYVSMAGVSTGHESCSGAKAWDNGMRAVKNDGAFLHPNAAGMRAVAKAVAAHLDRAAR